LNRLPSALTVWLLASFALVALVDVQQREVHQTQDLTSAQASLPHSRPGADNSSVPALNPLPCMQLQTVQEGLIPMPTGVPAAHASNLLALPPNHPLAARKEVVAFWFAGSRESGADVQIAASLYDRATQRFDPAFWVANRHDMGKALGVHIRRLGNPVAWADQAGRIHLFVVATGLGGWAASRIVHLREEGDLQFKPLRVLPLMPLLPGFNTSTLVRAAPLALADGGAVLPIYFELGLQYGMALRLNALGEMQSLTRITQQRDVLQPSMVAVPPAHWLAFMRDDSARQRIRLSQSLDAGATWQDLPDLKLGNSDTSIAALRLHSGHWALAHNPVETGRSVLQLSLSAGQLDDWKTQTVVAGITPQQTPANGKADEYSYPTLIEVSNLQFPQSRPEIWLSYTHLRQSIGFKIYRANPSQCEAGGKA
jgi:predicted neuraminidase